MRPHVGMKDYIGGFSTQYTYGDVPGHCTEREVVEQARDLAMEQGWDEPMAGDLVFFSDETEMPKRVLVEPLTLENLRRSGIKLEDVEWVYVFKRLTASDLDPALWRRNPFCRMIAEYIGSAGGERGATYEEVIEDARTAAENSGRKWPVRCELILRRAANDGSRRVVVDPLTLESLRTVGIDMESVGYVLLYAEPR